MIGQNQRKLKEINLTIEVNHMILIESYRLLFIYIRY